MYTSVAAATVLGVAAACASLYLDFKNRDTGSDKGGGKKKRHNAKLLVSISRIIYVQI